MLTKQARLAEQLKIDIVDYQEMLTKLDTLTHREVGEVSAHCNNIKDNLNRIWAILAAKDAIYK